MQLKYLLPLTLPRCAWAPPAPRWGVEKQLRFQKPKPYLEIVGDLAVQNLSQQLPGKDTTALAGLFKMARA